MVPRAPILKDL